MFRTSSVHHQERFVQAVCADLVCGTTVRTAAHVQPLQSSCFVYYYFDIIICKKAVTLKISKTLNVSKKFFISYVIWSWGDHVMELLVEALPHKPEGRGFDSQ